MYIFKNTYYVAKQINRETAKKAVAKQAETTFFPFVPVGKQLFVCNKKFFVSSDTFVVLNKNRKVLFF